MIISIASDHGGFALKSQLIGKLSELNHQVIDRGCFGLDRVDYPQYAKPVCEDVQNNRCDFGVLICTTGIGMSIYANKFKGIRAALVTNLESARLARQHNNANIITMGARFTDLNAALTYVEAFGTEKFEGGRHERRVCMISDKENEK
ncbi:MAG TPA: ribose 5-phosphate isomerase B [Acholeplasmatales bacterium]|nr:ribose 5-phosphate isomerase B [Acholeplasmatales bacterium]